MVCGIMFQEYRWKIPRSRFGRISGSSLRQLWILTSWILCIFFYSNLRARCGLRVIWHYPIMEELMSTYFLQPYYKTVRKGRPELWRPHSQGFQVPPYWCGLQHPKEIRQKVYCWEIHCPAGIIFWMQRGFFCEPLITDLPLCFRPRNTTQSTLSEKSINWRNYLTYFCNCLSLQRHYLWVPDYHWGVCQAGRGCN